MSKKPQPLAPRRCQCGKLPLIARIRLKFWTYTVYCPGGPQCLTPAVNRPSKNWAVEIWNEARSAAAHPIEKPKDLFRSPDLEHIRLS